MGAVYEIALHYDAQEQSLTTLMTEDGLSYGPIQNISLDEFYGAPLDGFTDLNVDSIVLLVIPMADKPPQNLLDQFWPTDG